MPDRRDDRARWLAWVEAVQERALSLLEVGPGGASSVLSRGRGSGRGRLARSPDARQTASCIRLTVVSGSVATNEVSEPLAGVY